MPDDDDDDDDEHDMMWEEEADRAIRASLDNATSDDVRGSITLPSSDDRSETECTSLDDLIEELIEIYDAAWYASVPFDGGEAVFESDAWGNVGDALGDTGFEDFFIQMKEPEDADRILTSQELIRGQAESQLLQIEFRDIGKELAEYFAKHPERLRDIDPYAFEKLMAAVYRNRGFDVKMTPKSKDGGFDLILLQRNDIGAAMTLVDCKRYAAHKKVGVEIVRGLYGTVEAKRATSGLIVTTSYFTAGAIAEREQLKFRMGLADFDAVKGFLKDWRK